MANRTKAIFLDRDGTIIVDAGYTYRVEDLEFLPGAIEALRRLQEWGFALVIVTNQSGIARGLFTEADYECFTAEMLVRLSSQGVQIAAVYHCPHLEGCNCRKPKTGMFLKAREDLGVCFEESYAIGDQERDLSICIDYPVTGILIGENGGTWSSGARENGSMSGAVYVAGDLASAVQLIDDLESGLSHVG